MDAQTLFDRPMVETVRICREAAQAHVQMLPGTPAGQPDALARVLVDAELVVDPRDRSVAIPLCGLGIWEWWVSKAILRALPADAVAIDIGANAGYYTALMLQAGAARVMAIEPLPELVRRLRASRLINRWDNRMIVLGEATGACPGSLEVCIPAAEELGGTFVRPIGGPGEWQAAAVVPVAPLDDQVCRQLGPGTRVDLIKIDAEGSEPEIWAGMQGVLRTNPDCHVFAEVMGRPSFAEWLELLWREGWVPMRVAAQGQQIPLRPEDVAPHEILMVHLHRNQRPG